jgi:hypothetical protein
VVHPRISLLELDSRLGFLRGLLLHGSETRTLVASTDPIALTAAGSLAPT